MPRATTYLRRQLPRRNLSRILHPRPPRRPHQHPPPRRLHSHPFWISWLTRVSSPKSTQEHSIVSNKFGM